jgi:hypothetical protein
MRICNKRTCLQIQNLICRKCSIQKLPQFPHGNNGLDTPSSITHRFLWRDSCVSST